jgi:CubicO group peptidase (beta-lactamase class C family)
MEDVVPIDESVVALLEGTLAGKETPAAAVAVARSGGPVSLHAAGLARWEPAPVAAAADTVYLLASVTKPFTATAVMQLAERGRLLLDDPVARHLPEFGAAGKEAVTVRHLLAHTSGLDEAAADAAWEADRGLMASEATRVASVCRAPLAFAPGTMQQYCSAGYRILAALVERLSGMDLAAYVSARIAVPLGLTDTAFRPPQGAAAARAAAVAGPSWPRPEREFRRWGMTLDEMLADFLAFPYAGGGLWSTLLDLVTLGRAYLAVLGGAAGGSGAGALLSPAALRAMLRPQTRGLSEPGAGAPGPVRGLGFLLYGLDGGYDFFGPRAFGHGGATGTLLVMDPDQDLVVVFLANRWRWDGQGRLAAVNAAVAAASRG